MLEMLLQLLGELLIQLLGEALVELGFHAIAEPFRKPPNPWLAAAGYLMLGAIVGGLSVLAVPAHLVSTHFLRMANLLLTPVAAGFCMAAAGAWRARRGQALLRIDRFAYGYLFALSFALMRFWLAC
ncbi:hypothetical protein LJR289_002481 [Pseudoduganella sp. LjRoot289]|uniref:hypothetical protein n=1 Tax=Pseudoduganella sp. LjRoot289 TaxID=3342314 RepID=UPI003ECEE0C7